MIRASSAISNDFARTFQTTHIQGDSNLWLYNVTSKPLKFSQGDNEREWRRYGRRLDSISQIYAVNTCDSHAPFSVPEYGSTSRKDAMTPVPMDSANVGPTFWVKEFNPFDPGLDLVRSQELEEIKCEW